MFLWCLRLLVILLSIFLIRKKKKKNNLWSSSWAHILDILDCKHWTKTDFLMISTTFVSQIVASFSFPGVSRVRSLDLTPLSLSLSAPFYTMRLSDSLQQSHPWMFVNYPLQMLWLCKNVMLSMKDQNGPFVSSDYPLLTCCGNV